MQLRRTRIARARQAAQRWAQTLGLGLGLGSLACGPAAAPEEAAAKGNDASAATAPAQRTIASNVVATDELLWQLGPQVRERVVAVSSLADDARYSQVADLWPSDVARLGTNPEEVLARAPTVIFVASFSTPEYRAALEGRLEVAVLEDFSGFAGYRANLDRVGDAVGARDRSDAIKLAFDERQQKIEARRPSVRATCLAWNEGYVPGAGTTFFDVAKAAGCEPIAASKGIEGHQALDLEQILAWDPDVFVVACEGDCAGALARIKARPGLAGLRAVREGKVAVIEDAAIGSVGDGMLDFAVQLQGQLLAPAAATKPSPR